MLHFKRRIANFLLRHLWNAVSEDQIISFKEKNRKRVVFFAGKEISPELAKEIAVEARFIKHTQLYALLKTHIRATLNKHMYQDSKTDLDLFFGKAGLWHDEVVHRIIDKVSKIDS
jgi:hypothetical protein